MAGPGLALATVLTAAPLAGQTDGGVFHYSLRLLDLGIAFNSRSGVSVIAAPTIWSNQGLDSAHVVWLHVHPDTLIAWLALAHRVQTVPLHTEREERIQWTRPLRSRVVSGELTVGRSVRNGRLRGPRWLVVADSGHNWTLELEGQEADSLLTLLQLAATRSGWREPGVSHRAAETPTDPVEIISQPKPAFRGEYGRVYVQYVVGTDGRAEPGSIVVLLASAPELIPLGRSVIERSRFRPARLRGEPVRQHVFQVLGWYFK